MTLAIKPRPSFKKVYRFKITLAVVKPPVWRCIEVPGTYSFWDLHVAITDCFGWLDYHLHEFDILNPRTGQAEKIGMPDEDAPEVLPDRRRKIARYFTLQNPKAIHRYDFGDGWQHSVALESIQPRVEGVSYPRCIGGKRAGPPEDCGGPWGYTELLKVIQDPSHEEHQETVGWLGYMKGEDFDPERFDPATVRFDDPDKRWRVSFEEEDMTPDMRCWDFFKDHYSEGG